MKFNKLFFTFDSMLRCIFDVFLFGCVLSLSAEFILISAAYHVLVACCNIHAEHTFSKLYNVSIDQYALDSVQNVLFDVSTICYTSFV